MLQGLLGRNSIFGIVDEDALQKIQEQTVEVGIGWDEFLGVVSTIHPKDDTESNIP